LAATSDRKI